ncbi:MAG: hypothetical protein NZ518_00685, partial [Dehalococcoidia bacterium]|nr:hypothetical protein [Dehalococcoidia bacterium]
IVNIFDVMSELGLDPLLEAAFLTPRQETFLSEANTPREQAIQNRLRLLDDSPALARAYRASPDPLFFYGVPTARIRDMGGVNVLRTQRAVLQQWLAPRPWARPGDILVANGGDLAKQIGVFPREAVQPLPPEVAPLSVINVNQPAVAPVFAPVPPAAPPFAPPLFPTPIFIGAVPTPGPTITPTLTATPRPAPTENPANCNGDERLTFDPSDPVAGQQFTVNVTSARRTRNVGLVGPGIVDGPFVFGGGRGTVWQWVVVTGVGGLYGYTFFGNGSACATGQVFVSSGAPFPGPPPPIDPPRPTPPLPTIAALFGASRAGP